MNQRTAILLRFMLGFSAVAVTCALAIEKEVWREQVVILLSLAAFAGVACAFSPGCARAIRKYWMF